MKNKKLVSLGLAASMAAVLLSGCSSSRQGSTATTAAPETKAAEVKTEDVAETALTAEAGAYEIGDYKKNFVAATNVVSDSVNSIILNAFKDYLEEHSNGQVTVSLYEQGTMGNDAEIHQGITDGTIDIISSMTSGLVNVVPEAAVFDMPSVWPSIEVERQVMNGEFGGLFNTYTEKYNVHCLGFSDMGYRQTATIRDISTVVDLSGMKIRTMDNKYHLDYWNNLGAAPTPMDWSEVYTGLQQKTVEAVESPMEFLFTNNFYEVADHIAMTNHLMHIITFLMNNDTYQGLPEDVRRMVDDAAAYAVEAGNRQSTVRLEDFTKKLEEAGCIINELDQSVLDEMQEKSQPVYDEIRVNVGDELVDGLLDAIENAK